jgi:hypothetical protein
MVDFITSILLANADQAGFGAIDLALNGNVILRQSALKL